jgi:lathosterol oxidase
MPPYIQLFLGFFLLILITGYLLPAGGAYYYFFHWQKEKWLPRRIQKLPKNSAAVMKRDISWSLLSILIFAILSTILYLLIEAGHGKMYFQLDAYGWLYLPLSLFLSLLIHDIYFYFVHRMMHHRAIFRYVHAIHHKTTAPTPWTIYAFQPLEAVLQYSIIYVLVFLLPLHPVTLFIFIYYNIIANVGGHSGHEFTKSKAQRRFFEQYINTVTHHDLHHATFRYNYSQYFNFLDRLLNTYRER